MAVNNKLTVINGILAQFAMTPVATVDQNDSAKIINNEIDRYLPLFQKTTLDWSSLFVTETLDTPLSETLSEEWQFTFALPNDYIRPIKIFNSVTFEIRYPYIYTNSSQVELKYMAFNNNYALFEQHFIDYFIYFCAQYLVIPLTRDEELAKNINMLMEQSKIAAQATELRLRSGEKTLLNPRSQMIHRSV